MKRFLKKGLTFLLCAVMIFGVTAANTSYEVAEARTLFDIENELNEYKSILSDLQKELAAITKDIADLEDKSGETSELLTQYQAQIDVLEADIMAQEAVVAANDIKRAEVTNEMILVQEDYDYRASMYKNLMQFIYENSNTNSFELLFSSEGLSDYLTKRDNFNDIMSAADRLLKDIESSLAVLEARNAELLEIQAQYDENLKRLKIQENQLEQKIEEFETIASDLNLDAGELAVKYKEKNTKISDVKKKISELEKERKEILNSSAAFQWPIKSGASYRVTSQYGWRKDPFGKPTTEYHRGIDIACSRGTPILAVKDGIVTQASDKNNGYGNCVIIYHGNGISSLYAHCDNGNSSRPTYHVKVGDSVKAGQVIAYVGTTGRSTGYHLHFGVIDTNTYTANGRNYVNPNKYLPDGYYTKKS